MSDTKIRILRSSVPGKEPTAEQLDFGQLAINFADEKLFFKNSAGEVKSFSTESCLDSSKVSQIDAQNFDEIHIPLISAEYAGEAAIFKDKDLVYVPGRDAIKVPRVEVESISIGGFELCVKPEADEDGHKVLVIKDKDGVEIFTFCEGGNGMTGSNIVSGRLVI